MNGKSESGGKGTGLSVAALVLAGLAVACGGDTGGEPATKPEVCADAESIREQILAKANEMGVAAPCEKADGGYVEAFFATACSVYEEKNGQCCAATTKWCGTW